MLTLVAVSRSKSAAEYWDWTAERNAYAAEFRKAVGPGVVQ